LHKAAGDFANYLSFYRVGISLYSIVCIIGFFQGFQMQPRLAMLTQTLYFSAVELTHHLIVVLVFSIAFAASGHFLFGLRIFGFSAFPLAWLSSTPAMVLGDFDWESLGKENFYTSAVWLLSFVFIMTLVMVNMFMAIVMDIYTKVKQQALAREPVWVQLMDWVQTYRISREWVSTRVLVRVVNKLYQKNVQRAASPALLKLIPGMSVEQADHVIHWARRERMAEDDMAMSLTQFLQLIGNIAVRVGLIDGKLTDWRREVVRTMVDAESDVDVDELRQEDHQSAAVPGETIEHGENDEVAESFREQVAIITKRLDRLNFLLEDFMAWSGYRHDEVDDVISRIENIIEARLGNDPLARRPDKVEPFGRRSVI